MDGTKYEEALAAAEELLELETEDEAFENLGVRIEDIKNSGGYERSMQYSADFAQDAEEMLSLEDFKKIAKKWWAKLEPQLMNLICDSSSRELGTITGGKDIPTIAAGLATAAVISALAPPAWIIAATTILATKIVSTGLDAVCETWRESLE